MGKKTHKGSWIKMYSAPCFANSVSQISNNTGSLQHHRGVCNGLLRDDIKDAAEEQTGVRVSFQIQTVRISCWIQSGEVPGRWRHRCGTSFPGWAELWVRAPSSRPPPLTRPWQLRSALWCKMQMAHQPRLICNHIWHPARRLGLATTLIDSATLKWRRPRQSSGGWLVRSRLPALGQSATLMSRRFNRSDKIANNGWGCGDIAEDWIWASPHSGYMATTRRRAEE